MTATPMLGTTDENRTERPEPDSATPVTAYADVEALVRAELVAARGTASPSALDAAVTRVVTIVSRFALDWAEAGSGASPAMEAVHSGTFSPRPGH